YGLVSLFIQARSFKSVVLTPIIFIIKLLVVGSQLFYVFYGFVIQSALMIIVGIVLGVVFTIKLIKKHQDKKKMSIKNEIEGYTNVFQDESVEEPYNKIN